LLLLVTSLLTHIYILQYSLCSARRCVGTLGHSVAVKLLLQAGVLVGEGVTAGDEDRDCVDSVAVARKLKLYRWWWRCCFVHNCDLDDLDHSNTNLLLPHVILRAGSNRFL
jgi:hypothetical protein